MDRILRIQQKRNMKTKIGHGSCVCVCECGEKERDRM